MMNQSLDDKFKNQLLKYLKGNEKKFGKINLSYYYHYVRAYFVNKINLGMTQYRGEVFEIFKIMKNKKLFLIDNIITDMEFNSVVNISLPLKEYDWLDDFIEEYKNYLEHGFSKDAYNLARAKLLYERKEFEKVFQHLNAVEFKDPSYYYDSKFILGRVFYETGNIEGLKYIIINLRQYIRIKNILNPVQIAAIKTYNKYMVELMKISDVNTKGRKSLQIILRKELDNEKSMVPNKKWFYEKLAEMSNK